MKFLIAVPNLNYGRFLGSCLTSIQEQRGVDVAVTIVDGGSSDESLEVAEKFCTNENWKLINKEGIGQAASIQLALDEATDPNTILCWLNSDDVYLRSDALSVVAQIFETFNDVDVVSLGGYFITGSGKLEAPVVYDYHPLIRGNVFLRGGGFLQPATFWRRQVHESVKIDLSYKYVFDGDFFLRMKKNGFSFYLNSGLHIAGYRLHGDNLSLNIPAKRIEELSLLYAKTLERPGAAIYLSFVHKCFSLFDRIPLAGQQLKWFFRVVNNGLSYFTRYIIPSI